MPEYLRRCAECTRFIPVDRQRCSACARAARLRETPRRAGWTYLGKYDCAGLLALLCALLLAAEFRLQIASMEQWPYWYCPPGGAEHLTWADVARIAASVGLPGALLFGLSLLGLLLFSERERGLWLPDAWFPVNGRWLKYLLAATLCGAALLLQLPFAPWGWGTIPGVWLCLLGGARVWEQQYASAAPAPGV